MKWLKQNALLVVSGIVALGLLGFSGYFLWDKMEQKNGVTEQLNTATTELERLLNREVHPSEENIKAAKSEQQRLAAALDAVKSYFPSTGLTNTLEGAEFKAFLENAIHDMTVDAERSGVTLPPKPFNFSFTAQRPLVNYAAGSIDPLTWQVMDIKALMSCLFQAKIHSLVSIRRASVSSDDPAGSLDYVTKKMSTNAVTQAVIAPYEVTFQCFSTELADALSRIARAPVTFVLTNVVVSPGTTAAQASAAGEGAAAQMPSAVSRYGGMDPATASRYGLGGARGGMSSAMMSRYGLTPGGQAGAAGQPAATAATPGSTTSPIPKSGPQTVIDEKPLKVTITAHSMRIHPVRVPEKSEKKTPRPAAIKPAGEDNATQ